MLEKLLIKLRRDSWNCSVHDAATGEMIGNVYRLEVDCNAERYDDPVRVTLTLACEVDIETGTGEIVRLRMKPDGSNEEIDRIQVGV